MREASAEPIARFGKRQLGVIKVAADDRRQLEEVAHQHDLHAAERGGVCPDVAADRIHHGQGARRQHRDLIDDQHARPLDAGGQTPVGAERVEVAAGERVAHADAAPGMDGDAMTMDRSDAGGGRIGELDALPLQGVNVAVDRVGLAAARLAGEEEAGAGLEQRQRLVLGHGLDIRFGSVCCKKKQG